MMLLLFSVFFFRPPEKTVVFTIQQIEFKVNGEEAGQWENNISIGRNRIRIDKGQTTLLYDFRLELFIYIDHKAKIYRISDSSISRPAIRRFFGGIAAMKKGALEHGSGYLTKLNQKKIVHGFPCSAFKINYPEHFGIETTLWTFPHPVLSTSVYKRIMIALLGSDVPGDAKYVLSQMTRETWGTPISIKTRLTLGEDLVEISSSFIYIEMRKNSGSEQFDIPKGYTMAREDQASPLQTTH